MYAAILYDGTHAVLRCLAALDTRTSRSAATVKTA
jgi:hypothetical protein